MIVLFIDRQLLIRHIPRCDFLPLKEIISTFLKTMCGKYCCFFLSTNNIRICTSLPMNQRQNDNTVDEPQHSMAAHILNLRALEKKMIFFVRKTKKNTLQHLAANQTLSVWRKRPHQLRATVQLNDQDYHHRIKNELYTPLSTARPVLPSGTVLVPVPQRGPGDLATEDFVSINNFIACQTFFRVKNSTAN